MHHSGVFETQRGIAPAARNNLTDSPSLSDLSFKRANDPTVCNKPSYRHIKKI